MAIMVPENLKEYNFTKSEKVLYQALKEKLSNKYRVYFSVTYHIPSKSSIGTIHTSEIDFVILHPEMGLLCIEVKGGRELTLHNGQWQLKINDQDYRVLGKSPLKQAEDGVYALKSSFKKKYMKEFSGNFGFAACFPFFNVKNESMGLDTPRELIIDNKDLDNPQEAIERIFRHFNYKNQLTKEDFLDMSRVIYENRFYGITRSQEIAFNEERFSEVNFLQDSVLKLLEGYRQVKFNGAAGTGKTWIALKKAVWCAKHNKKTLLICHNRPLADFMKIECHERLK
ncbi:MAG: NERD domain-containing protein/DEAD/DEAH box helicase, partial [Spirochaetota bacterium]|nr:NERD domain-containing protein/DEAD/DEAH box helicase [Spirochaetota bacterium]